jgi:hypothetical protein
MKEIENSVSTERGDNHPEVFLESHDRRHEKRAHHRRLDHQCRCGSPHNSEQNLMRGDHDEQLWIEYSLAIKSGQRLKRARRFDSHYRSRKREGANTLADFLAQYCAEFLKVRELSTPSFIARAEVDR